jgi:hypothetical protein
MKEYKSDEEKKAEGTWCDFCGKKHTGECEKVSSPTEGVGDWEKEFDNNCITTWRENGGWLIPFEGHDMDRVKSFIRSLLRSQAEEMEKAWLEKYGNLTKQFDDLVKWREEMERKCEELRKIDNRKNWRDFAAGYNKCLDDIINIIQGK